MRLLVIYAVYRSSISRRFVRWSPPQEAHDQSQSQRIQRSRHTLADPPLNPPDDRPSLCETPAMRSHAAPRHLCRLQVIDLSSFRALVASSGSTRPVAESENPEVEAHAGRSSSESSR
mmetsp:Transcript_24032/g.47189  ORF Transcript_24032/g.47189 Transcript_24032/m.47189 type:complete len:118 (-) Transcript_24032:61-414(-)